MRHHAGRARTRGQRAIIVVAGLLASVAVGSGPVSARQPAQIAAEVSNQPTEELTPGVRLLHRRDALLTREADGLGVELRMTTPQPATYIYPDEVPPERQAAPEFFTLWVFVFNHPEACYEPYACGPTDFNDAVQVSIYGAAGHLTSIDHSGGAFVLDREAGGEMIFSAHIAVGDPSHPHPAGYPTYPLENATGAEVHAAIAPHGQLVPEELGTAMYEPVGGPTCGCWWTAEFPPPGRD
jgi:hypothetical protein